MKMRTTLTTLLLLLISSAPALADNDRKSINRILDAIITGWEQADGAPFRQHFLDYDGARYIESGGQNVGLTDLIEHHVEPEGDAIKLELSFNDPDIHIEEDFAWVVVDSVVRGTILKSGRKIHNKGFQTVILRKIDGDWKVLHTHSSGRPVKKD
jgi:hypothetical protein